MKTPVRYSLIILAIALGASSFLALDASAARKKTKLQSPQISRGIYFYKATGYVLEVAGNRFRYYSDDAPPSAWEPISKLRYITKGVVIDARTSVENSPTYWCLSTLQKHATENCTKNGWQKPKS
jgi:hypothetical protein